MATTGAELLVAALAAAGVKTIYSLSGNQIMPVYDACLDHDIRIVHVRHESAAVFMADAHAQLTGEVGVALVTAAPGFANAVGALYTAGLNESPVLLLSGDSPVGQDGQGAFQELDQVSVSAPLTKLSLRAGRLATIDQDCARALRVASSGRPGPVHLALPFDTLSNSRDNPLLVATTVDAISSMPASPEAVSEIAAAIGLAKRPIVITGPLLNRTRAGDLRTRLGDALQVPVVAMESPRGLNDPALGDLKQVLAQADLIVSLGKRLDFTVGFGSQTTLADACKYILVDADETVLAQARAAAAHRLTHACHAGIRETAEQLANAGAGGGVNRGSWPTDVQAMLARRIEVDVESKRSPIHPAFLAQALERSAAAANESVLVIDGGEVGQWVQAYASAENRLINGPAGAIGGSLCYAIAAKVARPNARVIAAMGDGTCGFHFSELETAARIGANVVFVIGNDLRWNAEYQIQVREYGEQRTYGCELSDARYDQAAAGLGCHAEYVTHADELDSALERAVNAGKPAVVNVLIQGLPAPASPSAAGSAPTGSAH